MVTLSNTDTTAIILAIGLAIHQVYVRFFPMNIDITDDNCPTERRMVVPAVLDRATPPQTMQSLRVDLENARFDASNLERELVIMGRELTERDAEIAELRLENEALRELIEGLNSLVDVLSRSEAA